MSFLSDNVVIFKVKGNNFRLVVKIAYERATVIAMRRPPALSLVGPTPDRIITICALESE